MPNYENFITYDYWQYEAIRHMFALTAAVFAASLVYFVMSVRTTIPRLRTTSYISAVVMISAALELGGLWLLWNQAFDATSVMGEYTRVDGQIFSNGYRYANWLIDVPMLLTQFIIVLGFMGAAFWKRWWPIASLGVAMILTGYVGQYYEPQVAGFVEGDGSGFWIWGIISWLLFFALLFFVHKAYRDGVGTLAPEAQKTMKIAWLILFFTWFLYGFAYLVPAFDQSATGVVVRQFGYTFADIVSKTIFGVVLARVAMKQSAFENPAYRFGEPDPFSGDVMATADAATLARDRVVVVD